ncbi:DUF72 domain-containing protein [Sanguibacter suaedae]|uniref:DUF72 domain-containing protein n=1 Tax=Sanguibacter suaedae TaxID=2795737 RepID=A0A934ICL5_9MICO|nr:DUF72 domain-containing protein [Sanguibacter suaedae]MBI9114429.1 DUF72 domain-containing protein [Sanguibacter suaedae]
MAGRERPPEVRVGISGWRYAPWRGVFYPEGLVQRRELEYVGERLSSVEINGSFYSLQRPSSYERWRSQVPDDFVFSVKGPRYVTHMLRLVGAGTAVANFFASGVLALGPTLGPVLWQLPERAVFDAGVLSGFLAALPRSTDAAAELARGHDDRLEGRTYLETDADRPVRHVLEVRGQAFTTPEALDLLREHDVGIVVADTAGRWPMVLDVTSDVVYVRLHGSSELYVSGYTDDELALWAGRVQGWLDGSACPDGRGRDVFVYLDNDAKVHAPFDALRLTELLAVADATS